MFSTLSPRLSSAFMSWLSPIVKRLNKPRSPRTWPMPALAPQDLPEPLRERLLRGLLAACQQHLQRHRAAPADIASSAALRLWSTDQPIAQFSEAILERPSVMWLAWLEEAELRLALRALLAPVSAFGSVQPWQAALVRQTTLAKRLARVAALHDALARRRDSDYALSTLERALAALANAPDAGRPAQPGRYS